MAKMFYTIDEAAAKLGMSADEVQALVESGQLQEFRDRDNLMFKVDQVDLLAGDDDDDELGEITLADTSGGTGGLEPISLSSSGSGSVLSLESTGDSTGVSIFDAEDDDAADANAETLVSDGGLGGISLGGSGGGSGFGMDAGASGSGLAQLAFEPDDTSLGGNLLDDLAADSQGGASALGASALGESALGASAGAGALFEGAEETETSFSSQSAAPMMVPMGEAYDGPASGLFGGIALGSIVVLMLAMAVMILGLSGGSESVLAMVDQNMLYMVMGGGFVAMMIFGGVGWAMLRKS